MIKNHANAVLNRIGGVDGQATMKDIVWFVPQYTPNTEQPKRLSEHFIHKTPIDFSYLQKAAFMRNVKTEQILIIGVVVKMKQLFFIPLLWGLSKGTDQKIGSQVKFLFADHLSQLPLYHRNGKIFCCWYKRKL